LIIRKPNSVDGKAKLKGRSYRYIHHHIRSLLTPVVAAAV